jgi:hypothetical protein
MSQRYLIPNGPAPTTAAFVKVTTGNVIKTMMQVKLKAGITGRVVEWGISFAGFAAALPIQCELIETGTVAATITQHVAAGIMPLDNPLGPDPTTGYFDASSTTATGYTASAEGTITESRLVAPPQLISPTNQHLHQFPLGYQAIIGATGTAAAARITRIRVTAGTAVDAYCYMIVEV